MENNKKIGIGGYGEDRFIYKHIALFSGENGSRTIHLGIDIWVPAGTIVYAPINSWVHSFRDNSKFGDYGATIVLEHHLNEVTFYSLYGHLSRSSLKGKKEGMEILKGDDFAMVGNSEENGHWPPHLHFQLISDMLGWKGDFYGVAPASDKDYYMNLCPDPEKMLKFE
ncbi:MAG: peptidoglycan DD-metalloendopeptidase family protein [Bacteroidota bacterium]